MRGPLIAAAVVAVAAVGGGIAFWLQHGTPAPPPAASVPVATGPARPPTVRVAHPSTMQLPESLRLTGELRTAETLALRTPMPGQVGAVLFKEGQRVAKGQALVRLDDAAQKAELQQARAGLAEARRNHERSLQLRDKGFLSGDSLRESEALVKAASARKEALEARLAAATLRAPAAALTGRPLVKAGDMLGAGSEIVELELMDPLDLEMRVPAAALAHVRERQTLAVTVQGLGTRSYAANVLAIDGGSGEDRALVHAQVRNRDGSLRSGMHARVRVPTGGSRQAVVVPGTAVAAAEGRSYVFKVVEGKASRQEVRTGQREDGNVEIVSGVAPEDLIVVAPEPALRDGMVVDAVEGAQGAQKK